MSKAYLLVLFGIGILLGCSKDNPVSPKPENPSYCSKTKFQIIINDSMVPVSIIEDCISNILILGNKNGKICLIKTDTNGTVVWNRTYHNISGVAARIIVLNDNSIVISSFDPNITVPIPNLPAFSNVWIQNSTHSSLGCNPEYSLDSIDGFTVTSKSYLSKLDQKGELLWTNSYDECIGTGKSILKNANGNINMVTIKLKGRVPVMVWNQFGVFQDTVNYPEDDNLLSIYEIDIHGNTIWKKEIPKIYNRGYSELSVPVDVQQTVSLLSIKTEKNIIYLNTLTNKLQDFMIHEERCTNQFLAQCGNSGSMILSGKYFIFDTVTWYLGYIDYFIGMDESQNVLWENKCSEYLLDCNDEKFAALSLDSSRINIYKNSNGVNLMSFNNLASKTCVFNCNKGLTLVKRDNGQLQITRTNSSGEF